MTRRQAHDDIPSTAAAQARNVLTGRAPVRGCVAGARRPIVVGLSPVSDRHGRNRGPPLPAGRDRHRRGRAGRLPGGRATATGQHAVPGPGLQPGRGYVLHRPDGRNRAAGALVVAVPGHPPHHGLRVPVRTWELRCRRRGLARRRGHREPDTIPGRLLTSPATVAINEGLGSLRASDADREQAVEALKAAFVHDRLAKNEFEAHVARALTARTYAELATATTGIPAPLNSVKRAGTPSPI